MHLSFVTWDCVSIGSYCIFRSQQYERDSDGIAPLGEGYNEIDNFSLRKAGEKVIYHLQDQTLYSLKSVEVYLLTFNFTSYHKSSMKPPSLISPLFSGEER